MPIATLADYREEGFEVTAWCGGCQRQQLLDLAALAALLGPDYVIAANHRQFTASLRCTACGHRGGSITVSAGLPPIAGGSSHGRSAIGR